MLKTTSKVYYVYEFGGEYEDKWEHAIGVCSSLELAKELKAQAEASRQVECSISEEEYCDMLTTLFEYEEERGEVCEDEIGCLLKLFPGHTREELEAAERKYHSYDDFIGVNIEEIDFYN